MDFQKALACSIVSAELPENITVDTSAIFVFVVSRDARLADRLTCMHSGNQ